MAQHPTDEVMSRNRLLAAVAPADREQVSRSLTSVSFVSRRVLYEAGERINRVYFPIAGMISMVTVLRDGTGVEAAVVGCEGIVSEAVFLGDSRWTNVRSVVQIECDALSASTEDFRTLVAEVPSLDDAVTRWTRARMVAAAQDIACNRMHALEQRAAKWLLMTADRAQSNSFPITHEFLAQMVGAQRPSVSEVIAGLAAQGAVSHRRSLMIILDRAVLEKAACECYSVIRAEFERILPPAPSES